MLISKNECKGVFQVLIKYFKSRYQNFVRESAIAAQTKSPQTCLSSSAINSVWWDGDCNRLNDAELVAFREFTKNGTSYNHENYLILE
jgi:hypothetical protein